LQGYSNDRPRSESGTIAWQSPDPVSLPKEYSIHSEFIAKSCAVRRSSEATV